MSGTVAERTAPMAAPRPARRPAVPGRETVVVTDGEQRSALALVRSLGAAGHRIVVVSRTGRSLAGASRWCAADHAAPDPLASPAAYANAVLAVADDASATAVLSVTEPSLLALLPARDRFTTARIPAPPLEAFRRISDKALLTEAAPSCGIAIPVQRTARSRADALAMIEDASLAFPLVLKPARSVGERDGTRLTVRHAASREEMRTALRTLPDSAFPLLVQQRLTGAGVGIFLLRWAGRTLAVFSHRRLLEKPPSGGVSVYRESIAADPVLVERSCRLLDRFDWEGVAMVEYKLDAAGTPHLMEINGRFWGSLQLAIDAGVDFPGLLLAASAGLDPEPVTSYRVGVRSRWWWGQVDHLVTRLRRDDRALHVPGDSPPRWRVALGLFAPWRSGERSEILRFEDPAPFLRESLDWITRR